MIVSRIKEAAGRVWMHRMTESYLMGEIRRNVPVLGQMLNPRSIPLAIPAEKPLSRMVESG